MSSEALEIGILKKVVLIEINDISVNQRSLFRRVHCQENAAQNPQSSRPSREDSPAGGFFLDPINWLDSSK